MCEGARGWERTVRIQILSPVGWPVVTSAKVACLLLSSGWGVVRTQ